MSSIPLKTKELMRYHCGYHGNLSYHSNRVCGWCLISKGSFMPNLNSTPYKSKKLLITIYWQILHHVIDIVPALANHFIHHLLEHVVQTNWVCQPIRNTYLQFNCSLNLARKFVSFDWRVHQTQSNKNRICSDNWSSCNACISLVKAGTLFEYQLKIAWSNIACKHVWGLTAFPIAT